MYFDNRPGTYILNARIRLEEGTNNSQVYFDGMGGGFHEKPDTDNRKFTKVSGASIITNEIEVHFHGNFHTNALIPVIRKIKFMEVVTPIFHTSNYDILWIETSMLGSSSYNILSLGVNFLKKQFFTLR